MELLSREEVIKVINEIRNRYMTTLGNYGFEIRLSDKAVSKMQKDAYEDIDKMIEQISTITLIRCGECKYLVAREILEEPMKSRLPKELIGKCDKTGLYVHIEDYCCGGEE